MLFKRSDSQWLLKLNQSQQQVCGSAVISVRDKETEKSALSALNAIKPPAVNIHNSFAIHAFEKLLCTREKVSSLYVRVALCVSR